MQKILSPQEVKNHVVVKYEFKKLESINNKPSSNTVSNRQDQPISQTAKEPKIDDVFQKVQKQNQTLQESLLKKIDELSTSLANMEIRFEKQEKEFEERLITEKQKSFLEGKEEGKKELNAQIEAELDSLKSQILHSIEKIKTTADEFVKVTTNLEKELVDTAIDIAKEVIQKEVEHNSAQIAHSLASELLKDIKSAMKIKIKVNPEDLEYLKNQFMDNEMLEIIADTAVAKGGIIIESDAGSVDGTIISRFENIKKTILEN